MIRILDESPLFAGLAEQKLPKLLEIIRQQVIVLLQLGVIRLAALIFKLLLFIGQFMLFQFCLELFVALLHLPCILDQFFSCEV